MIIYRYLAREVYATILAISVILLLVFMSNQFVHYMRSVVHGHLTAHLVLLVLSLKMPILLAVLLPLGLFLGLLLVYGRMYADNEMTVLSACGVSRARLTGITFSFAGIVAVIAAVLMLWIGPHLNKYADSLMNRGAISPLELIQSGQFQTIKGGQWVFYVGDISRDHKKMHNVFVAEQPSSRAQKHKKAMGIMAAQLGYQQQDKKTGDTFLIFKDGNRYLGVAGQKNYRIIHFSKYGVVINRRTGEGRYRADAIPTMKLLFEHNNNLAAAELQWRLSIPLMALVLGLLAMPLSQVKTRHGRYAQLVPAMLLYIIYGNFMFVGRDWIKQGVVSHFIGMWWVHLIMLLIVAALFMRQGSWQRMKRALSR